MATSTLYAASAVRPPAATGAPSASPSASVQQFGTQQLGGILSGRVAGGIESGLPQAGTQRGMLGQQQQSAVQLGAQKTTNDVALRNQKLNNNADLYAQRRAQAQNKVGSNVSFGNSLQNPGKAWTADGRLSASRNKALQMASSYLGSRYVLGGTSKAGIDCSGLVMMVYNQLGYKLNHSATAQGRTIPGVRTAVQNLRPGDLVAWKDGSHIAIYAGNGEIIEAANPTRGTLRRKIWANPGAIYGIQLRLPGE